MGVIDYILAAGFRLTLEGEKLYVEPASKLTDAQREYIRSHKAELLAELLAANGAGERLAMRPCPTCGRTTLHQRIAGKWLCTLQHPATLGEALRQACQELAITPNQVREALSAEDLAAWEAGQLTLVELQVFAKAMDRRLHGKPDNPPAADYPLVPCWTPTGDCVVVRAEDEKHAAWLRKMNPPPAAARKTATK